MTDVGEMHVRGGGYVGVAPMGDGTTNVCAVTGRRPVGTTPLDVMRRAIDREPALRDRFRGVEFVSPIACSGRWRSTRRRPARPDCCSPATPRGSSIR